MHRASASRRIQLERPGRRERRPPTTRWFRTGRAASRREPSRKGRREPTRRTSTRPPGSCRTAVPQTPRRSPLAEGAATCGVSRGYGVSKPSGPAGQTLEPGWKVDKLGPFRRVAGETVITHFGGEKQTTLLPTVRGVCNHAERHVAATGNEEEEDEENEKEEKDEEDVDDDPLRLDFFVTDEKIFVQEKKCLDCPGKSKGILKVSEPEKKELGARTPPICVTSFMTINSAKRKDKLVERPA